MTGSSLADALPEGEIISILMRMAMQNRVYLFIIQGQISEHTVCLKY